MSKQRIGIIDKASGEKSETPAYVVEAINHLNQKRNFAFDGRVWFYQHRKGARFEKVSMEFVPQNVITEMHRHSGIAIEILKG